MKRLPSLSALIVAGCSVTPLTGKITPGDEAFVIVVGEGDNGETDLFAAPATNGTFYRLTFSRPSEESPKLSPEGKRVAFLRRYPDGKGELAILNLENMAETLIPLDTLGHQPRIGWSALGDSVAVFNGKTLGIVTIGQGGLTLLPVAGADNALADSISRERLGDPVFAMVDACRKTTGLCAVAATGETPLGAGATDPFHWGKAAVAYLTEGRVEVRPLGGGSTKLLNWPNPPKGIRQPTYYPGPTGR